MVWHGLRRRSSRPRPAARRRLLAAATSTGLVAPLFVLDGLPDAAADPAGPDWDRLGSGSVVMASNVVGTAPPPTSAAVQVAVPQIGAAGTDLLVQATPWVRAAGVAGMGIATPDEVQRAEDALGLTLGRGEVSEARVERLRRAQLQPAHDVCRALGLLEDRTTVQPADVVAAAIALDVPTEEGLTPDLVAAVVEAGAPAVVAHLEESVTPYARALGLDLGRPRTPADTAAVAAELGIELSPVPGEADAARLHTAWLQTLAPHFDSFGLDEGAAVDPVDTVALARALGADVDSGVGPAQLGEILAAFEGQRGDLVPYGRVGDVTLHLPSQHVARAGWHQSFDAGAIEPEDLGAERAVVLPSRGRGTGARSAMDVAVQPGTPVLAPVTGTVVEVTDYALYGKHPDVRIRIRPDANPALDVVVLHVTGPHVAVGDHVEVGDPLTAHATKFPFRSQIDDLVGPLPHVHLQVTPAA